MSTLDTARAWVRQGVSVIPVKPRSKEGAIRWQEYTRRLPTETELKGWFDNGLGYNLGVVTGPVSGNLAVLDFDHGILDYWRWRAKNKLDTYAIRTARGVHAYLFANELPAKTLCLDFGECKVSGYVLGLGSIHPSGHLYGVLSNKPIVHVKSLGDVLPNKLSMGKCVEGCVDAATQTLQRNPPSFSHTEFLSQYATRGDVIGAIRRTLPIVSLLARYTDPRPSSTDGRWFVMTCPFHSDSNPSFWADKVRGICGCFNPECRAKQPNSRPMDVINAYARLHKYDNRRAILELAQELNLWG